MGVLYISDKKAVGSDTSLIIIEIDHLADLVPDRESDHANLSALIHSGSTIPLATGCKDRTRGTKILIRNFPIPPYTLGNVTC